MPSPGKQKRTPFMKNSSQWKLVALLSLSKFCDYFRKVISLHTKDTIDGFGQ